MSFYSVVSESKVLQEQTFQVQYVVEGARKIEKFTYPEFPGFDVVEVFELPLAPRLNPFTRRTVEAYTRVAVLSPRKLGKFNISGATASIDGKSMKSNLVKVEVVRQYSPFARQVEVEDESELRPGQTIEGKVRVGNDRECAVCHSNQARRAD